MTDSLTRPAEFHRLLSGLTTRLPDETLSDARRWLAAGDLEDLAVGLTFAAINEGITLRADEIALLTAALPDGGAAGGLPAGTPAPAAWPVTAVPPGSGGRHPYLDATGDYDGPGRRDEVDEAVVAAAPDGAVAIWRGWRGPDDGEGRRMYLVQVAAATDGLPAAAVPMMDALESTGDTAPQVETFAEPGELSAFSRGALSSSALIWTPEPAPPVRVAPTFGSDHPMLDPVEAEAVLAYLDRGTPVLIGNAWRRDILDPDAAEVVPDGLRTDGSWVWTEAAEYYVARYALAPVPELLKHIRENEHRPPAVSAVALHRVMGTVMNAIA